jgi:hypothetical protein
MNHCLSHYLITHLMVLVKKGIVRFNTIFNIKCPKFRNDKGIFLTLRVGIIRMIW